MKEITWELRIKSEGIESVKWYSTIDEMVFDLENALSEKQVRIDSVEIRPHD